MVILGGSKVSDKIGVIKALMEKADAILIGGAMANTFWKAQGVPIGASRVEADKLDLAREILDLARKKGVRFCCRWMRWKRTRSNRRHGPEHQPGHANPWNHVRAGRRSTSARDDQSLRRRNRQGENDSLERPGRDFRNSGFRPRHNRDCGSARANRRRRPSSVAAIQYGGEASRAWRTR